MKLLDYITGNRRGKEAHRIEKDAMADPFLSEALEGFDSVDGDHAASVERLRHRVTGRAASRKPKRLVWVLGSVAAFLLLFFVIGNRMFFPRNEEQLMVPYVAESLADTASSPTSEIAQALTEPENDRKTQSSQDHSPGAENAGASTVDILQILPDEQKIVQTDTFADFARQEMELAFAPAAATAKEENAVQEERDVQLPRHVVQSAPVTRTRAAEEPVPDKKVTGQVVDEQGNPLPGVAVAVQGTTNGTITDVGGNFHFQLPGNASAVKLEARSIGFDPATVAMPADSSPVLIAMNESEAVLDEVVVIGYATQKRSSVTGSSVSADMEPVQRSIPEATPREGEEAFREYIRENQTPVYGVNGEKVSGKVVLEFRVNRQGRPVGIRVVQSLSTEADAQARQLLEKSPDWSPADGRVRVTIPF